MQVFRPGMQEEVNVRVNQPRHERTIAQIDNLGARLMFHLRTNFDDAITFDQNFAWLQESAVFNVEQPRRMQHDYMV